MDTLLGTYSEFNGRLPYLRQITSYMGRQITKERQSDAFFSDHTYAKPWNSNPCTSRSKPARLLFFSYPPRPQSSPELNSSELIDIEGSAEQSCPPPYDMTKAKSQMNEWETHLSNISIEEGQDDWEEQINRTGWTTQQSRIFGRVCKILNADSLAKLACAGSNNEPVMRRIYVDKGSKRLRQVFASFHWDNNLLQWLHSLLLENLNVSYLAAYLDMMQTLKSKVPALVSKMVSVTPVRRTAITGPETSALWNRKPWDPILPSLTYNKLKKLPGSPLLVVVPFAPSQGVCNQTKRMRFWMNQLANMGKVVPVTMYAPGGGRSAIVTQCMEHIIGATRTKINELRENFLNRPIILIGWGVGSLIACYMALQEKIAAVVCLGFQMGGLKGSRGDVDDPLLESRVPTLFVVGQNSPVCGIDQVEEFREKMKTETSLVIVGGADEWLRINHYKKKEEGITQTAVDRCLLDEISNFLGATLTSLPFQSHDYLNQNRYHVYPPAVKENKRRKRKLDTILEFADEGGVEAPATKWRATSFSKNEYKPMSYTTTSFDDSKSLLSLELNLPKTFEQSSELPPKIGVKPTTNASKRSYVRKSKVHIPVLPESTSSDSSSTSCMSSNKSVGPEKELDDLVVNPTISAVTTSPNTSLSKNNSLSFNIGFLSSLGQVRRSQPSTSSHVTLKKSPEVKPQSSELNTSTAATSVLHLYKALSGLGPKPNPISIYSVPARSAFSIPKAGVRPTIGISSLLPASNVPKFSVASSSILTSTNAEQPTKRTDQTESQTSTLEPDQEQVQAIQKLQFHDFPLTTASLTKSTSGVSITQAKILSNYNIELKKLPSPTGSGMSSPVLLTATPSKSTVDSTSTTSEVKSDIKMPTPQNVSINTVVICPTPSSKPSIVDSIPESSGVKDLSKRSPVSLIVLTPTKVKEFEVKGKVNKVGNTKCLQETIVTVTSESDTTETNPVFIQTSNLNEVPDSAAKNTKTEKKQVQEFDNEFTTVLPVEVSDKISTERTSLECDNSQSDAKAITINVSESSSSEQSPEKTSPSRGKFKAPSFPTIAATRTRRIRTPKYMYYDL